MDPADFVLRDVAGADRAEQSLMIEDGRGRRRRGSSERASNVHRCGKYLDS
jgi:hypothetical protein